MKIEQILSQINDETIMLNFLKDLTTPQEFKALQERLDILLLLNSGLSYAKIAQKIKASTTTIGRVARFLKQENNGGYQWILDNLIAEKIITQKAVKQKQSSKTIVAIKNIEPKKVLKIEKKVEKINFNIQKIAKNLLQNPFKKTVINKK